MDWYYANERDEQIQVSEDELKALAEGGTIRADTLVWNESLPDWKPCRDLKPEWFSPAEQSGPAAVPTSGPIADQGSAATSSMAGASPSQPSTAITPAAGAVGQPPPHYRTTPPTDGLALASLICGITGLVFMFCYGGGIIFSIAAVICGHLCRSRLVAQGNTNSAGLALAGLITGYIGVGLVVIFILIFVIFFGFAAMASTATMP